MGHIRENPGIPEEKIATCLHMHYGLQVVSVHFLPIGFDLNAVVCEVVTNEGISYFLKIRSGEICKTSLLVPHAIKDCGIPHVLAPLPTITQDLWCSLDSYTVVLYPFIRGESAKLVGLTDRQWVEFGATLNAIHSSGLASQFRGQVPIETFTLPSGDLVRRLQDQIQDSRFDSPAADRFASFWKDNARRIQKMVERAEALGKELQSRSFDYVLCHSDIHSANILVGEDGEITLVDWDSPLIAPRERDLMLVVAHFARPVTPREKALFFQGYGPVDIDPMALTYYRYERHIEDIGEVGRSVFFDPNLGEETKAHAAQLVIRLFQSGNIVGKDNASGC